jgi:flavorubredoxin
MNMRVVVIYESTMGRTRAMAQAIGEGARVEGAQCDIIEAAQFKELDEACALAVGSSTRMTRPLPRIRQILSELNNLNGITAASFGSYGWSGEAPDIIANLLMGLGAKLIDGQPVKAKDFPGIEHLEKCRELGRNLARACAR